jgi:hypothetical protein
LDGKGPSKIFDIGAIRFVAKDDADFARMTLSELMTIFPDGLAKSPKEVRHKGRIDFRLFVFNVPHPTKPGELLPIEVQIMTQDAYEQYFSGSSLAKYRLAHYLRKIIERHAPMVGGRLLGQSTADWQVRFDHQDPPLVSTGHAGEDLKVNISRILDTLAEDMYVRYPVNAQGEVLSFDEINADTHWARARLPAGSSAADWLFTAPIGGVPENHRSVYILNYRNSSIPSVEPLGVGQVIPQGARLALGPPTESLAGWELEQWQALWDALKTPRAQLLVKRFVSEQLITNTKFKRMRLRRKKMALDGSPLFDAESLRQKGRGLVTDSFGHIDEELTRNVLGEVALWLGFADFVELYQALGAGYAAMDALKEWYRLRYIEIDCSVESEGDYWILSIHSDEDQTRLFQEIVTKVFDYKWTLAPDIEFQCIRDGGDVHIILAVMKNSQLDIGTLGDAIKGIRRPRGGHQPIDNGQSRFIRIEVDDLPKLKEIASTAEGMNIVSIRAPAKLHEDDASQTIELTTEGPDTIDATEESKLAFNRQLKRQLSKLAFRQRVQLGFTQDLIRLSFDIDDNPKDHPNFISITEKADESQVGVLKDVFKTLQHQGWIVPNQDRSIVQTPLSGEYVVKAEIRLSKPKNISQEELPQRVRRLEAALNTIHRFRGERLAQAGSQRGTLHLTVENRPGVELLLLNALESWEINNDQVVYESQARDPLQWWELDVSAPAKKLTQLYEEFAVLSNEIEIEVIPEVFWDIGHTTMRKTLEFIVKEMGANPTRKEKFFEWMKEDSRVPLPKASSNERGGEQFINNLKRAFAIAARFHADQKRDDGASYVVHLLETLFIAIAYLGIRDPIFLTAILLHDVIEDGPRQYLLKARRNSSGDLASAIAWIVADIGSTTPDITKKLNALITNRSKLSEAELEPKVLLAIRELIQEEIGRAFPDIKNKLFEIIGTVTHEKTQLLEAHLSDMTDTTNTVRTQILYRAFKMGADRVVNLKDRRLSAPKQAEKLAETLQHFIPLLAWKPETIDDIYRASSRLFLATLMKEVAQTSDEMWASVVVPYINKATDFPQEVENFRNWMSNNPDCVPDVDATIRLDFEARLDSLIDNRATGHSGTQTAIHAVLNNFRSAANSVDSAKAMTAGLDFIDENMESPEIMAQWVEELDRFRMSTPPKNEELLGTIQTLRSISITNAIDSVLKKHPWDASFKSEIQAGEETLPILIGEIDHQVFRIGIGPLQVVDQSLVPAPLAALIRKEPIVLVEGPLHYANYLVPVLANLWEIRSTLAGATIFEDGIGSGVAGLTALRLGARRLVGIDNERSDLLKAAALLHEMRSPEGVPYKGRILSAEEWPHYQTQPEERYLLIHDDLKTWYSASTAIRQNILGNGRIIRLANIGPNYVQIYWSLVEDLFVLSDEVILGGFMMSELAPEMFPINTIQQLNKNGWEALIKPFQAMENFSKGNLFYAIHATRQPTQSRKPLQLAESA